MKALRAHRPRQRGLTLIETLVALLVLAIMAGLGWRGLQSFLQTRERVQAQTERFEPVRVGLAQWRHDLDQLATGSDRPLWQWDGKVLRLTRRGPASEADLRVVAWARLDEDGHWARWLSPPLQRQQDWQQAWDQALQWGRGELRLAPPGVSVSRLFVLDGWKFDVYRGGAWVNPMSNQSESQDPIDTSRVPSALRLELRLPEDARLQGLLRVDWLNPSFVR